jgi:NADPH:quinone reductase-like Zn-dependent oxidoreductase
LGTDVAGEVHEVGEGVTHVKKGDRVIGYGFPSLSISSYYPFPILFTYLYMMIDPYYSHAFSLVTNDSRNGGFQEYSLIKALVVAKIPSSISYTQAAVLPLSISTAAATLFQDTTLALPLPSLSAQKTNKSVLVWGGSSSVGASAIQLAVGAGVKVVATAGKHNIDAVKKLGASEVFDHSSPTVSEDIIKALEGTEYAGVSDCIGTPDAAKGWTPVYKKLGGKYGSVMPDAKGLPEGIQGESVFAPAVALKHHNVGETVWGKYVPEALESGAFKPMPEAEVIKGGLEKVQEGIDKQRQGVSFKKIVVEL